MLLFFLFAVVIFYIALVGFFNARTASSWFPQIEPEQSIPENNAYTNNTINGSGFSVHANHEGRVNVVDNDGRSIVSSIMYYSSPDLVNGQYGLMDVKTILVNDSMLVIEGSGLNGSAVSIYFASPSSLPRLDIKVRTSYPKETKVAREALAMTFDLPVTEVYKKNRTTDRDNFSPEYWLNRQGVRFGIGDRQSLIYQTPGVSSLQLNYVKKELLVNLEYCLDHPYIYFPYQADNGGLWIDQSTACYPAGSERTDSLSIWFGNIPVAVPRLMMLPYGYLAGYVFTEHADGGNLQTHRAVYFGCDTITKASNAIGGFYGNRIPVTKSVFYADKEDHPDCIAIYDKPEDEGFLDYLLELQSTGLYDICLHTPEDMNSDKTIVAQASLFMKDHFVSTTWIDHGMMGGENNRECFEADAFNASTDFYCADIWQKYGLKYFWNTSYELKDPLTPSIRNDIMNFQFRTAFTSFWMHYLTSEELRRNSFFPAALLALKKYVHKDNLYLLDRRKDEAFPVPIYWMNSTRTDSFYSWGTHYVSLYDDLWTGRAEKKVKEEKDQIDDMIENRAIFINHGYYVRGIPEKDLTSEKDGRVYLNPYFEQILAKMSKKRDDGDLMITTISDLLDYQLKTERISFEYSTNGIKVINNNECDILGLSMAIRHADVIVDGSAPKSRKSGEDMIFWYNIRANDSVNITIKPATGN